MAARRSSTADRFEGRLEFESLISELPSRFMGAPPDQVDQGIVDALRRVCALLDLDLAVLAVVGV
jgi:hypothetical protein